MATATCFYQPAPTIEMPKEVRFNSGLTWGERVLYAELISMCKKGKCPYHQGQLAKVFNVSCVCMHKWIKRLQSEGLIEIIMNPHDDECRLHIKIKKKKR